MNMHLYTVKKKCGEHTKTVAYSTLFQKSVLYATVLVCPPHFFQSFFTVYECISVLSLHGYVLATTILTGYSKCSQF